MCGEALKGSDSHFLVKRMTHLRNLVPFLTFNQHKFQFIFSWALVEKHLDNSIVYQSLLSLHLQASLQKDYGMKTGEMLWNYSRGIDNRLVGDFQVGKRPSFWLDILSLKSKLGFLLFGLGIFKIFWTHTLIHLFSSIVHRANLLCKLPFPLIYCSPCLFID